MRQRTAVMLLSALTVSLANAQTHEPVEVLINGVEFVRIPAGEFWYPVWIKNPDEATIGRQTHREVRVWLDTYYLAKHEARSADLERYLTAVDPATLPPPFIGADGNDCSLQRLPDGTIGLPMAQRGQVDRPAANLSWTLANEFASWMGFRLPTEAEWVKGARGSSDTRTWPWGDEFPDDTFAHFSMTDHCAPAPVSSHPKGRSPYGLHHMAGNVAEWVLDWYSEQFDASLKDGIRNPTPAVKGTVGQGMAGPTRIEKGGRWSPSPEALAIPRRATFGPDYYNPATGVRFAVDASAVTRHLARGTARIIR